ncbi:Ubiquinol-cytochrome c reductase iron-sulfur subunit [Gammaproteobacteria bacterium]
MNVDGVNKDRRRFLLLATSAVGGVGAAAALVPFVSSMQPSAKAQAAGAPVEVDISKLEPGQMMTVEWRGKPVWVVRRTKETIDNLRTLEGELRDPKSEASLQPVYATNQYRSITPEYLVVVGVCTHLGCSPTFRPEFAPADLGPAWKGGFFCPCHGSRYDLAGRVYSGVPAPLNLDIPPYNYVSEKRILVGQDPTDSSYKYHASAGQPAGMSVGITKGVA